MKSTNEPQSRSSQPLLPLPGSSLNIGVPPTTIPCQGYHYYTTHFKIGGGVMLCPTFDITDKLENSEKSRRNLSNQETPSMHIH
ncbi:hypothetical protein PROFUN_16745 [Planoprotostelium fungivorum]|uniref:Uncharacterized protein n=1 Tax=Planoprotostelium fungivorum TaxID=1890364 RepID=A0A2P6MNL4_9EUKA|nr:hypothetical protein PROFUN_16745 [Planoprotostelium fungivorum]